MKRGHALRELKGFPSLVADKLAALSISTAEEFLAQYKLDPSNLRDYVDAGDAAMSQAVAVASRSVDSHFWDEVEAIRNSPDHPTGALPPTSDEFNRYMSDQGEEAEDHDNKGGSTS